MFTVAIPVQLGLTDHSEGLSRIPAAGGAPHRLTDAKADSSGTRMHLRPQTLPGGKGVLFVAANGSGQSSLRVVTVNDGKVKTLVDDASFGRYLADGYLVYSQRGALFAATMDAGRLELTGLPALLVDGVSERTSTCPGPVTCGATLRSEIGRENGENTGRKSGTTERNRI